MRRKLESSDCGLLRPSLRASMRCRTKSTLPALVAHCQEIGVPTLYDIGVGQDARDSTKLRRRSSSRAASACLTATTTCKDDAKLSQIRDQYRGHIERMLTLAGVASAASRRATRSWRWKRASHRCNGQSRKPRSSEDLQQSGSLPDLRCLMPGYRWQTLPWAAQLERESTTSSSASRAYLAGLDEILRATPLPAWQAYFRLRTARRFCAVFEQRLGR